MNEFALEKVNAMPRTSVIAGQMNQKAILELLFEKGPLSKADISRMLHLSFPAVSRNVEALLRNRLIYEAGMADNALGRKATLLAFNAQKGYLIGIDIGRKNLRAMCADISGEIIVYEKQRIETENVVRQIIGLVYSVAASAQIQISDVVCMGVGIPGIYDPETDTHRLIPYAEAWSRQSLMRQLKEEFAMDIFMENSVNLGAVGERWKGVAKGYDHISYVDVGVGIGSAAIIDGNLLRGKNSAFGEIGYMVLEKEALSFAFSDAGALERLIPSEQIGKAIAALAERQEASSMPAVLNRLEKEGNPYAKSIPTYFAMALVNTIAVINPEILVISGKLGCALYKEFAPDIDRLVLGNILFPPRIVLTELAEKANVLGAIALAMIHSGKGFRSFTEFT